MCNNIYKAPIKLYYDSGNTLSVGSNEETALPDQLLNDRCQYMLSR